MSGEFTARRWVAEGRVQGVGYRWYIQGRGQELGVRGWVRNLPDGAVEVVGMATPETLERFERIVRAGPPGAEVHQVRVSDVAPEDVATRSFRIRR